MTTITGRQIRDGSITGADLQDGSIELADLSAQARQELAGAHTHAGVHHWHGFPFPYEVDLRYDRAARQVVLTPRGESFSIWLNGVEHVKTGVQTSPPHGATTGNWYCVYGADGTLQMSDTPWDILGAGIPVCYVYYNAELQDALPLFELHTAGRNLAWHRSQHFALGTFIASGLELFGYAPNTNTTAAVTWGLASGVIIDEDIRYAVEQLPDATGGYTLLRRAGPTSWAWSLNQAVPYLSGATYIQYNQNVNGDWQLTELSGGQFVNYWIYCAPLAEETAGVANPKRILVVPGQSVHASLSAAQAESPASLAAGDLKVPEFVAVWRTTFEAKANYTTPGKAVLAEAARLTGTRATLTGNFAAGTHNALSGRDAADAHPASAISGLSAVAVTGNYSDLTGTPKLGLDPSA